jgi:transposase
MLVKNILNFCHKFNSFIFDNVYLETDNLKTRIIVDIKARSNGKKLCSICRRPCIGYDRLKPRLFKFIPIWGIPVFFRYARRRVNCPVHGIVVEYIPWSSGKSHLTDTFKIYLSQWAKYLSWNTVAEIFHVNWYQVFESVEYVVEYGLNNRVLLNIYVETLS